MPADVKVNGDLTIAQQYLNRIMENSGELGALSLGRPFNDVEGRDSTPAVEECEQSRKEIGSTFSI